MEGEDGLIEGKTLIARQQAMKGKTATISEVEDVKFLLHVQQMLEHAIADRCGRAGVTAVARRVRVLHADVVLGKAVRDVGLRRPVEAMRRQMKNGNAMVRCKPFRQFTKTGVEAVCRPRCRQLVSHKADGKRSVGHAPGNRCESSG
ncbi:MAG: hypothetical protein R3E47_02505 [Paracoccaceae bacterium]